MFFFSNENLPTGIAYQAAQRVMQATEADRLKVLREISQNFPLLAHSLVRTQVKPEFRSEIQKNQRVGNLIVVLI